MRNRIEQGVFWKKLITSCMKICLIQQLQQRECDNCRAQRQHVGVAHCAVGGSIQATSGAQTGNDFAGTRRDGTGRLGLLRGRRLCLR